MKIKESVNLTDLLDLGFSIICKEDEDEEDVLYYMDGCYAYNLGHSRRGQFYNLIVGKDRNILLYATKPDGSGGAITMDNIIIRMFKLGMIDEN